MHALLGREEASPSPVYGARLLSGFRLIPVAGSNPAASAIGISKETPRTDRTRTGFGLS